MRTAGASAAAWSDPRPAAAPAHGLGRHQRCAHRGSTEPSGDQRATSVIRVLSPEDLDVFFCSHEQRRCLGQGLLLAPELLLQAFDLALVLGAELYQLPLLVQGEHWLVVGILGCLPPPHHLLGEQAPHPAVGAEFGGVEASGLQHHRELVDGTPALRFLLGCRYHFSLQPPGLSPFVGGDHVDAQLLRNPGHALPVRRTHPLSDFSLDRLAVTKHRLTPSSPLVKIERNREASTCLAEEVRWPPCSEAGVKLTRSIEKCDRMPNAMVLLD
jgi:hypothetical protein